MTASKNLFKKYPNPVFVETGTHHGAGVQQALNEGFKTVYSIELNAQLFAECYHKFANNNNVNLVFGDSGIVLKDILDNVNVPITFWLDAHNGDATAALLQELEIIKNHPIKTHTILIDDLRQWEIKKVGFNTEILKEKLLEINSAYKFELEQGHVPNDILVAYLC